MVVFFLFPKLEKVIIWNVALHKNYFLSVLMQNRIKVYIFRGIYAEISFPISCILVV